MPCHHKFKSYLNLERLDFTPNTLIVGSFSPAWPYSNEEEWFYGRTADNYFWDILPRLYGQESLIKATPAEWKRFCHDKQVAITGLISSIEDADADNPAHSKALGGFSDKAIHYNFDDFDFVNIVQLLRRNPSIKNVYITRGITEAFWRHLWNPVAHYCNHNNISEKILLTPTDDATYPHGAYNEQNPDNRIPLLENYILKRWKSEWHF